MQSAGEAPYEWRIDTDASDLGRERGGPARPARRHADRDRTRLCEAARSRQCPNAFRCDHAFGGGRHGRGRPLSSCNTPCAPARARPSCGSRIPAAGLPVPDGKPCEAHGIIRVINDRYEREQQLAYLSRFDALTGEINRWHLTEQLAETLQEAIRAQGSCGFLLVAIDNLGRINEAYGYDVADEVIGVIAKRLRSRMRGDDVSAASPATSSASSCRTARRRRSASRPSAFSPCIRDDVVMTTAGPVSVTGTIGGVDRAAPCRQCRRGAGARAGNARPRQGTSGRARSLPISPISSAKRSGARISAPPTRSSPR